jgi:hypothetical protein
MEYREEQTIVSLLAQDPELKNFIKSTKSWKKKLAEFQHKHILSPEEELEMKKFRS